MPFKVSGTDSLSSKLLSSPRRVEDEVRDSLHDSGEDVKEKSQAIAPMLTGELRSRAYSTVDRGPGGPTLEVGYDGPEGYLIPQHEGMWRSFMGRYGPKDINNYTTPGTGPKWLERTWLAEKPRIIAGVREATRRALRG